MKGGDEVYLQFDDNRARQVFGVLQDLWVRQHGAFRDIVLPQDRVVLSDNPVKKANWLMFAAITMRGGIVSEDPFKYLQALEARYPDIMDPRSVYERWGDPERIQAALREVIIDRTRRNIADATPMSGLLFDSPSGISEPKTERKALYKIDEFSVSWWRNGETVSQRWGNNILNAFQGVRNFEEFFARADHRENRYGLHGMRRKILSLLTIWLQEKSLIPIFPTPVPVDFHAMRILFGTGVVIAREMSPFVSVPGRHPADFAGRKMVRVTERIMDEIARWSEEFIVRNGFSHLAINPALWVMSRELCAHELQNKSRLRRQHMQVTWSDFLEQHHELWPIPYRDPANVCPLSQWCTKTVAWGPYYDYGLLTLDRRISYPHRTLPFNITPSGVVGRRKNDRA